MDLIFPHHECEIAQSVASQGDDMVHYWMHNNMITINGTKMGKSLGNFITLDEFFKGSHPLLTQAYTPMTIRFFILQAHYRSTVDFSNEALQAAEKGLSRLMDVAAALERITPAKASTVDVRWLRPKCYEAMNDDLNSPIVIAHLFEAAKTINNILAGNDTLNADDLQELRDTFRLFCFEVLGLKEETASNESREEAFGKVVDMLLEQRMQASYELGQDFLKAGLLDRAEEVFQELTETPYSVQARRALLEIFQREKEWKQRKYGKC